MLIAFGILAVYVILSVVAAVWLARGNTIPPCPICGAPGACSCDENYC